VAIRIPIIADVIDAIRGTKKLGESFDDVADALQDVDRQSAGAGAGVESVGDHTADTADDADKMEASFRDAFDSVRKEARATGDDIGDSMRHGTDGASDGVQEIGREAESTAKETAASFDGSAESITGAFQEVAANAFAGFGPAGAIAGLAAAGGIGIVTSKMEEAKEKAQETAEQVAEIAGELIDLGAAKLGADQVADALNELATTADDGKIPLDELRTTADKAGIAYNDYAQGVAGDSAALQRSYDEVTGALDEYARQGKVMVDTYGLESDEAQDWADSVNTERKALEDAKKELLEHDATMDRAGKTAKNYADATKGLAVETEAQAAATAAAAAINDSYAQSLVAAGDPVTVYESILDRKQDAEQAAAEATAAATKSSEDSWEDYAQGVTVTTQDLIDEWNRQAAENAAFADNLAKIGAAGGQALADELKAKGPEVAGATAAAIAASDPTTQQAAIAAHAGATGTAMGGAMAGGISGQGPTVQGAVSTLISGIKVGSLTVPLKIDTAQAVRDYDAYVRNLAPVKVPIRGTPQAV
jgi:hypothetical protein